MICGVDEAGRGPVIGPLVVCGVCVDSDEGLRRLNVRDSKKLTPARREELAPKIRKIARVEIVEVPAEQIDGLREHMSLNRLEARIFASIIDSLCPKTAYIDAADADEEKFGRLVKSSLTREVEVISEHKADDTYPVVSAASIIAKVQRDARIREIEAEIGEPIGSGYTSDPETISFLERWTKAKKSFPPHTRKSWLTSQNIMMMNHMRRLDEFE
jgi:ribonuclease HII